MYIWKQWKRVRTRFARLKELGVTKEQAWQWANTRKGSWRISGSWILSTTLCFSARKESEFKSEKKSAKRIKLN
jgi:hypothetical protein